LKRIFPIGTPPDQIATAVVRMAQHLPTDKPFAVTVEVWKKPRTNQQNAYLWGVAYPAILEGGGEMLKGWSRPRIHDGRVWRLGDARRLWTQADAPGNALVANDQTTVFRLP
jgi:hypothetical protein